MRPIRRTVAAAGTFYYPVGRLADQTIIQIAPTGLTITSVSWTTENIRNQAAGNYVPAASAQWAAIAANADGSYKIEHPIDSVRIVFGGAGTANVSIMQVDCGS